MECAAEPMTLPGRVDCKLAEDIHRLRPFRDRHIRESVSNFVPDILCPVPRATKGIADHDVIQPACHGAKTAARCIQFFQALPELRWAVEWNVLLVEMTPQVQCLKWLTQLDRIGSIVAGYPQLWLGHEIISLWY